MRWCVIKVDFFAADFAPSESLQTSDALWFEWKFVFGLWSHSRFDLFLFDGKKMSIKLRELIRSVRACKTAAEERAAVAKECALIRTAFKEQGSSHFCVFLQSASHHRLI
jgi:hypothetical protein